MNRQTLVLAALLACLGTAHAAVTQLPAFRAPPKDEPVTETRFGVTTVDPYRRLEDLKDPEVQAWMKAQADRTRRILDAIPGRKALLADIERLSQVTTSEIEDATVLKDGRILLLRKEAGADIARLVLVDGVDGGGERVIVDPEDWRKRTGKPHAINYFEASPDLKRIAVGISEAGSEMASLHLFDLATAKPVEAPITRVRVPVVDWLPDGSGFVYNRLNKPRDGQPDAERMLNSQAYLHRLGTDAEQDPLVFGNRHDRAPGIQSQQVPVVLLWKQSDYMLGFPMSVDNRAQIYVAPRSQLGLAKVNWRKIVDREDNVRDFDVHDNDLIVMTSNSPDRAIERISLKDGSRSVVVPSTPGRAVDGLTVREDALYYILRERSGVGVGLFRLPWGGGSPAMVALPGLQTLAPLGAQEGVGGMLVGGAGWTHFPTVMQVDAQGAVSETGLQPPPEGVDASRLEATVVEVPSHDGTLVPLSIVRRTGTPRDGNSPTLLQGYGAYGLSTDPFLIPGLFAYFDRGFVRAFCHVRGGGEKGEAWYRAGFQATKANTWKDFNACAQYLVDQGYTSPQKLAALGSSAGGILVGNAMIERPDLYRAVLTAVGVMDSIGLALRGQGGPFNWPEFGNPNTEAGYKALHGMSSYHKVKDGTRFPAIMLIHGVEDPRVAVWQSSKMAARLQQASSSGRPVLLRLDYEAGHGIGSTQSQRNAERADLISFILWQFGTAGFQPELAMAAVVPALAVMPAAVPAAPALAAEVPPPAVSDTAVKQKLDDFFAAQWERSMRESPILATISGDYRYNDRWDDWSLAAFEKRAAEDRAALEKLHAIDRGALSTSDRLDYDTFEWQLEHAIAAQRFRHYLQISHQMGVQTADAMAQIQPFATVKDYRDWLARMAALPTLVDQTIALLKEGVRTGNVPPGVLAPRVASQIAAQVVDDPAKSPFYRPFTRFPDAIGAADRKALVADAQRTIRDKVVPAYRKLLTYFNDEYVPHTRDGIAITDLPDGADYYAYLADYYTTTDLTPDQIHAIGLKEVARIRAGMEKVKAEVGFDGTLAEFFTFLRTDPQFFEKTPEALLRHYRAVAKRIDPELVKVVRTIPRLPYGVRAIPDNIAPDAAIAYYTPGTPDGSRPGYCNVNLYKPETHPTWEMVPLILHECVPGHHFQFARALELPDAPMFRRNAYFIAYSEGWALYAERLGYDMGLYDDPWDRMGQLAEEMLRAMRLVVDTGMHTKGWSRERAIKYCMDNSPQTRQDVVNEIDRYIDDPGQALGYKIGQMKILDLRAKASRELGDAFDLRDFDDAVLETGSVPLPALERHIDAWIAARKRQGVPMPGKAAAGRTP